MTGCHQSFPVCLPWPAMWWSTAAPWYQSQDGQNRSEKIRITRIEALLPSGWIPAAVRETICSPN